MDVFCPKCKGRIPYDDLNISTDIALCRVCGQDYKLSDLTGAEEEDVDLNRPPEGAWYREAMGTAEVGASTRSKSAWMLALITVIFVVGSMGGIYGPQFADGQFNLKASLIGILFAIGSVALISATLMKIFGRVVVKVDGNNVSTFVGFGPIGVRKRFPRNEVTGVVEEKLEFKHDGAPWNGITLTGRTQHTFGSGLDESRRHFMLVALGKVLREGR